MANFLNFYTVEAVLTVQNLNQAIATNLTSNEAAVGDEDIAILILNERINISWVNARIEEEV